MHMSEMATEMQRRHFTVQEYDRMVETGIIDEDERVELLEGQIVAMPPMGDPHRGAVNLLNDLLVRRFAGRAIVQVRCPVVVSFDSKPEPDLTLLPPGDAAFGKRSVLPPDIYAALEVADTTRRLDYGLKRRLYGKTGIVEYWIIDLRERAIHLFREPWSEGYGSERIARAGDAVSFAAFPGETFGADDFFVSTDATGP